jgi:hypothetical protein
MTDPGRVHSEIGKGIGYVIAIVVGLIIVALVTAYGLGWFSDTTVDRRGQTSQQEQTRGDGTYRIAQYDAFFNLCNQVGAQEGAIDDAAANTAGLPQSIAATNLQAAVQGRRDLVADYNSRAARTATSGEFRDSTLPYQLPTTYTPNGAHTACVA